MFEHEFLKIISKNLSDNSYLGDDCAFLKDFNLVISTDTLVQDVHFSFDYMNTTEISKKSLLVNISDILASGALPKYALIALSGKLTSSFIDEFYRAINETAQDFGIKIIGGDLTGGDKLSITITILGDTKNRNISKRTNTKIGYIVGVMGNFGESSRGLEDLKSFKENEYTKIHKYPKLYPKVSKIISTNTKKPYAMMDSSDGLFDCLNQISNKSNVKIMVDYDKIPTRIEDKNLVLFGGEDYSLVFCMDEDDFKNIKKLCPDVTKIGLCEEGRGVFVDNVEIKKDRSYNHFE